MDEGGEIPSKPDWILRQEGKLGHAADSLEQARYRYTLVKKRKEKKRREIGEMLKSEPEPTLAELAKKAFGSEAVTKPEPSSQEKTPKNPISLKSRQKEPDERQSSSPPKILPTKKRGVLSSLLSPIRRALKRRVESHNRPTS